MREDRCRCLLSSRSERALASACHARLLDLFKANVALVDKLLHALLAEHLMITELRHVGRVGTSDNPRANGRHIVTGDDRSYTEATCDSLLLSGGFLNDRRLNLAPHVTRHWVVGRGCKPLDKVDAGAVPALATDREHTGAVVVEHVPADIKERIVPLDRAFTSKLAGVTLIPG